VQGRTHKTSKPTPTPPRKDDGNDKDKDEKVFTSVPEIWHDRKTIVTKWWPFMAILLSTAAASKMQVQGEQVKTAAWNTEQTQEEIALLREKFEKARKVIYARKHRGEQASVEQDLALWTQIDTILATEIPVAVTVTDSSELDAAKTEKTNKKVRLL
jgi:hypothetical protein